MPTPAPEAVELRRSDTVASDVSASKHHLSERAEVERRASDTDARTTSVAADSNLGASGTQEQRIEEATATAAEEAAAAAKTEVASEVSPVPEVGKQSNVIKAERTDHASWDVQDGSNVTGFCCCFERPAKKVGR